MTRFADYRSALHNLIGARPGLGGAQVTYSNTRQLEAARRVYIADVATAQLDNLQVFDGVVHLTEAVTFVVIVEAHGRDETQAELDATAQSDLREVLTALATIDRANPLAVGVTRVSLDDVRFIAGPGDGEGAYQARAELTVTVTAKVTTEDT